MSNKKLSSKRVLDAITEHHGNLSAVARALGVARSTVYAHVEKDAGAALAVEEARETILDEVEATLEQRALDGHTAELIFFLKTRGKKRGYSEKQEVELTGSAGGPIVVASAATREQAARELSEWRAQQQASLLQGSASLSEILCSGRE